MTTKSLSLSLWERVDLFISQLSAFGSVLCRALTGVFRGQSGAKTYKLHVGNSLIRAFGSRLSPRQFQHVYPPTKSAYETFMKSKGIEPESVTLNDGATAHWIGNKNAKNVVVYYHGGGFVIPAADGHFEFFTSLVARLNAANHDVAIFFLAYTLAPQEIYPVQLRQSADALRYILTETGRSPSNVVVGGDSAGGNLALALLLHLSHPHPDIEPLGHALSSPLAGVVGFAPWVDFGVDGPTIQQNRDKDMIPEIALVNWSREYLGGKEGDEWSEPNRAPVEWWRDAREKTQRLLFLTGNDEILFSAIDAFVKKVQTVVPDATYVVGHRETHVAPVYSGQFLNEETQQGKALESWLAALF
ncbi:alpha/beta hydrolase fold protein [Aspergillus steynii IBT 23096]|uniref:Alpha/beta hydrolase fold protein n=1 Tax=Aspergillus steynii IBT 23096 TaxID=1392250 RepID=A0A2I2FSB7_9EURO|nr:alpha/beta hydrolase fold protein [Aspergillus steynii IBT 23096]PLB43513.1 alpha/beta hydrolase fold protein [Aspergillus steynii IBT 23096]